MGGVRLVLILNQELAAYCRSEDLRLEQAVAKPALVGHSSAIMHQMVASEAA